MARKVTTFEAKDTGPLAQLYKAWRKLGYTVCRGCFCYMSAGHACGGASTLLGQADSFLRVVGAAGHVKVVDLRDEPIAA